MIPIPDLSIIIVSWNTRQLLSDCLDSIIDDQFSHNLEIIIVDNNSTDGTIEMVKTKYSDIRLIENKVNVGFAVANNQGFEISKGRYIMYLNSDTIIKHSALQKIVNFMNNNQEVGILCPKLLNADGSLQLSAFRPPTLTNSIGDMIFFRYLDKPIFRNFTSRYHDYDKIMPVGWVSGACLVGRRDVINEIGGWDEDYFMYSEDVEICIRANERGVKVFYFPDAQVVHLRSGSNKNIEKKVIQMFKSRIKLRRTLFGKMSFIIFLFCNSLSTLIIAAVFFSRFVYSGLNKKKRAIFWEKFLCYFRASILHMKSMTVNSGDR